MSDIIQDAERLLDGATPGPWEPHADHPKCVVNLEKLFAVAVVPESDVQGSEDEFNRNLIAAAPELAQALAEETWEYSAQYKNDYTNGWKFLEELQGRWCTRETLTLWVEGNLHRFYGNIRLVRRRVSPPEVIE